VSKTLVLNRRRTAFVVHPDRRLYSQNTVDVTPNTDFRCCVKRCGRRVASTGSGWPMPVCVAHGEMLGPKLFDTVDELAGASAFNPRAVLECAGLVLKIQSRIEQVSRRGKAKRKP
jgi:hypothetical protein